MNSKLNELVCVAAVGLAIVGIIGVEAGQAADLAVKAPAHKAVTPYSWTGCYVGGFVGWAAQNDWKSTDLSNFAPGAADPWDFSPGNEAIGGGTLGCNWQANSWLVLGVEGEGGFLKVDGASTQPLSTVGDTHSQLIKSLWGNSSPDNVQYLRTLVRLLRQKLEADPSQPKLVISESGVGYRLAGKAASSSRSNW